MLLTIERVEEWIDDDLFMQFEAIAGPARIVDGRDESLSPSVQRQLSELCGDDYDRLRQLNAWMFLSRLVPAQDVILEVKRTCDQSLLRRLASAGTVERNRHNPAGERLYRSRYAY